VGDGAIEDWAIEADMRFAPAGVVRIASKARMLFRQG
jgi:hypothetical protein